MKTAFDTPTTENLNSACIAHLDRDRWPEFERELRMRRLRKVSFDCHHYVAESQPWEWQVCRCRSWAELEKVLNWQRVGWERKGGRIEMEGMSIFRCV